MVSKINSFFFIFKHIYNTKFIHSGEVDDDINFTYEDNTEVYGSCAASLHDQMWVFGGVYKKNQVPPMTLLESKNHKYFKAVNKKF